MVKYVFKLNHYKIQRKWTHLPTLFPVPSRIRWFVWPCYTFQLGGIFQMSWELFSRTQLTAVSNYFNQISLIHLHTFVSLKYLKLVFLLFLFLVVWMSVKKFNLKLKIDLNFKELLNQMSNSIWTFRKKEHFPPLLNIEKNIFGVTLQKRKI